MEKYLHHAAALRSKADAIDPFAHVDRLSQFTFFSANLSNFLPQLGYEQHPALFQEAYYNQRLNGLDQQYFDRALPFGVDGWDDALIDRLKASPGILCTLHIGSYRLISYLMAQAGVPFAILMSSKANKVQGTEFKRLFKLLQSGHPGAQLSIVEAEDRRALWELMALLKKGFNILVYLDGYTGLPAQHHQLVQIPFLAQHLLIRKGAAFLANRLEKALYPVVSVRKPGAAVAILAGKPIDGGNVADRNWPELALTHLFAFFGSAILPYPAQWENWFFIHQQIKVGDMALQETADATDPPNPDTFGLYHMDGRHYLLRKKGYNSYLIDDQLALTINTLWNKKRSDVYV